jgi:hypothetical protein
LVRKCVEHAIKTAQTGASPPFPKLAVVPAS